MKICFHTNFEINQNYIGGTERFLITVCKELEILGHEPFIVCSSLNEESTVEGIKVYGRIPQKIRPRFEKYSYFSSEFIKKEIIGEKYSIDALKRLSEYTEEQISDIKADVINFNSFASTSFLKPNSNFVVMSHENGLEYDSYWGEGFFSFFSELIKNKETELHKYNALITPSNFYANDYSRQFGIKVRAINLGICLQDFKISEPNNELRKKYFFENEGALILFPSRFQTKQKGHDIAIKACSILKEKNIPFKMIFTGVKKSCEKYLSDFYKYAEKYNVQDCVQITTFAEIQKAYENCDIVISPEKYCSYGLSISEALALGIPTILSDIPTYKEIAGEHKHAIFFTSESYSDLAEKIIKTINKGNYRNREEAIKFRSKFDLRGCARKLIELYDEVTSDNYLK